MYVLVCGLHKPTLRERERERKIKKDFLLIAKEAIEFSADSLAASPGSLQVSTTLWGLK